MSDSHIDSTSDGVMNRLEITGLALPEATFGSCRLAWGHGRASQDQTFMKCS
jgi:hypothetical protein